MAISNHLIEEAIDILVNIQGIAIDPHVLLNDIVLIAYVFDEEILFMTAINQVKNAMNQVITTRNIGQPLTGSLSNWISSHFQSQRTQKQPADLRIVYQDTGSNIHIRGFGHRHLPSNVYQRLYGR